MKYFIISFFLFLSIENVFSQDDVYAKSTKTIRIKNHTDSIKWKSRHAIFMEVAGNSQLTESINYDGIFLLRKMNNSLDKYIKVSFRIGYGLNKKDSYSFRTIPVLLNCSVGGRNSLELGLGKVFINEKSSYYNDYYNAVTGLIGYRFQSMKRGFFGKVSFTPTIGSAGKYTYFGTPFGGSIGFTF